MALDSVRPLCFEAPGVEGGTQLNVNPTELSPLTDALTAAGLFVNGPSATASDKTVLIDRVAGGSMRLTDQNATHVLSSLVSAVSGEVSAHDALRDLQHFLGDEGPGTGFASGSSYVASYATGSPLLVGETWYTTTAQTTKILSKTITYPTGSPVPASQSYTIYNAAGVALRTLTDTYSLYGPLIVGATRTWS